jgi:hypothetical protein
MEIITAYWQNKIMNKIIVPDSLNDTVLEDVLLKLFNSEKDIDLELPLEIDYRGFGILPLLFLIVFTWVRNKNGRIIIPISLNDERKIKVFAQSYFGYVLLSTIWKYCNVENHLNESLKKAFRPYTSEFHNNIDFLKDLPKEGILVPNFDHYSKVVGLSHWFYNNAHDFSSSPSGLNNTIFRILEHLGTIYQTRLIETNKEVVEDLQKIIWELMMNTHEHAILDHLNQVNLNPNTRGLFIRIQRSSKKNFISSASGHKGLVNFYENALIDGLNFILEISVFDSGPGLVKRYLGKSWEDNLNIRYDIDVIKKCLIKGQTSVKDYTGQYKGYGLDNVLKLLDKKKGFLKIRTGRANIYRDLIQSPYLETQSPEDIMLYDWTSTSKNQFINTHAITGTMITMAYPLNQLK